MKTIKQNAVASFIFIIIGYVLATIVGIISYNFFNLQIYLVWWLSLLIADAISTIIIFIFSLIFNNASFYDPYWSVQPPVILIAFALGKRINVFGFLLITVTLIWGIRLTLNWAYTFKNLTHQDWRYTMLKEKTGIFYPLINFIGIHMVPTLVVYCCTLPAVYAILFGATITPLSVAFLLVSLTAVTIQGIADIEMHKYRKNRDGEFNRHGLWKYSRHPNYLGEIVMWWGVGLAVVSSVPTAWNLLFGAIINTLLFAFVSIPMAEKRQSQKDGYENYKNETRILLPIKK